MNSSLSPYRPYLVTMALVLIVLAGTLVILRQPQPAALTLATPIPRPTATLGSVVVDVRGAVAKPGVYTLPLGSRVQDALIRAGSVLPNAETRDLNLARKLSDGEQINVPTTSTNAMMAPTLASDKGSPAATSPTKTPSGKININTATAAELDALPGIGPALAQRIVDYRAQNGEFQKIEDVKQVRGIGDVLFSQIKDSITLD